MGPFPSSFGDVNRLDMQEHQEVVKRAKAKQLKRLNFDVQDFMGQYAKVLNKLYLSFGLKIWEGWNMPLWGLNLRLKFWGLNLWGLNFGLKISSLYKYVARSLTFSSPFKGTFSLLLVTLVLFVLSLTCWTKFHALEDHSTSFGIKATFKLVLTVVTMLLPQGAMHHSITLRQPSSTNFHILMKNFIHLLTVAEEAVLEEEGSKVRSKKKIEEGKTVEEEEKSDGDLRRNPFQEGEDDMNWLDMQEHQGVVTKAKAKQLKSHKDQIEQEKFQGLNFDVQDFIGQYAKVLNKLEIENLP
ncbi:hypothetical protein M9H77_36503 [Catharanthus roseus]|uniref:Uncharacterized protein n=1 Tax=Catharanthus roseus TaxID=4058 RepID=A0ACB9ZTY8_CATRO|nr:hypothetical protein M9H77_36503 [Catharanthus roseus]